MATGLLALLDDIASMLDDVAAMTKLAVKKTAAVAGDDLAVGAEALQGLDPARELPIVWRVAKGSLLNKAWLVPVALALTFVAPWSLTPLLMFGGAFLCYEGVHKVLGKLFGHHDDAAHHRAAPMDAEAREASRISGAIRTDVILSAEIVVIALGAMTEMPFATKAIALTLVAIGLTIAIYGLIAIIVKADDVGLHLVTKGGVRKGLGRAILFAMPPLMKLIGIVGTVAMFLVGGGIMIHGIPGLEPWLHHLVLDITTHAVLGTILNQVFILVVGILVGLVVVGLVKVLGPVLGPLWRKVVARVRPSAANAE